MCCWVSTNSYSKDGEKNKQNDGVINPEIKEICVGPNVTTTTTTKLKFKGISPDIWARDGFNQLLQRR